MKFGFLMPIECPAEIPNHGRVKEASPVGKAISRRRCAAKVALGLVQHLELDWQRGATQGGFDTVGRIVGGLDPLEASRFVF